MDDYMKELLRRLGEAVNASVSESKEVEEIIDQMNEHGYEVECIETVISVTETAANDKDSLPEPLPVKNVWTNQDKKFLRAFRIAA